MNNASKREQYIKRLKELWYIISRNIFLLTNGIIALVVVLLLFFGNTQSGLFLGFILIINVTLGLAQDIRAWYTLQTLQLLTAPRVIRILPDGKEESVLTEEIVKGDTLKLKTGDVLPCDGTLLESYTIELSMGLLTGESNSFPKQKGDYILAGSIITAGSGLLMTDTVFKESRIARMTEGIRDFSVNESPIQKAVNSIVRYSGYILIGVIFFVIARGFLLHISGVVVIKNIGALASSIVPQGLVFALTLLFAYGATHLFKRNVLLQEVNAVEKLGRIKNLCMDKTGTLTENRPMVERMEVPSEMTLEQARILTSLYLGGSQDVSQTILALKEFIGDIHFSGHIIDIIPFSSWHPYGALEVISSAGKKNILLIGSGEYLAQYLIDAKEKEWLREIEKREALQGKRIICLFQSASEHLSKDLVQAKLSFVAIFILSSKLRPGIEEAITFFQNRGTHIRIISGDHPETVRAVALLAGVKHCDQVITGAEMKDWTDADFLERASHYSLFARIAPEQKEKIIEALKHNGFTAMVGDGANDALAIKKADLGIAMFEGAPATRQLASVVLMNNSFTALPGGVELSESIIKNAEIFSSLFFGTALTGLFFFLGMSLLGFSFPLTPLNITLINYFTVGFPGILVSYWTIWNVEKVHAQSTEKFLEKISPFIISSSFFQSLVMLTVFFLSPQNMRNDESHLLVILTWCIIGYIFFLFTPAFYRGALLLLQRRDLLLLTFFEVSFAFLLLHIPFLLQFFEVGGNLPDMHSFPLLFILFGLYGILQYGIVFTLKKYVTHI